MKTEDLIEALSRNLEPASPPPGPARFTALALAGLGMGLLLLIAMPNMGVRPDIGVAIAPVLAKAGFAAFAATIAGPLLLRLARPGRPLGLCIVSVVGFFALSGLVAGIALVGVEPERRLQAWIGGAFPWCLILIPLLALPSAALLGWLVRGLAPTRLTMTGAAIGAVSGGVGAMVYAMHCPVDSVAFVATWYALAIALCAALGALLGAKMLRW